MFDRLKRSDAYAPWLSHHILIANSKYCRFMARALATEMFDFADEADEPEATCPICKDCEYNPRVSTT